MEGFFLVIGCLVGLGFLILAGRALREGAASRHWRQVSGTVRQVVIESSRSHDSKLATYTARVDFEYQFEGARYRHGQFVGQGNEDRAVAVHCSRDYVPGKQVDVYVNERQPGQSTLAPGVKFADLFLLVFGIGVLGLSLWGLLK